MRETGRRFRDTVLALGGGRAPADVFKVLPAMMALFSLCQPISFAPAAVSRVSHNATKSSSTISAAASATGLPERLSDRGAGPHSKHTTRAMRFALQQMSLPFWELCALRFRASAPCSKLRRSSCARLRSVMMADPGKNALRCYFLRACPVWRRTSEAGSLRPSRCCAIMTSCKLHREIQFSFCSHVMPDQMCRGSTLDTY